jgi:ABC-type sugar transport system ATPase subunit
MNEPRPLDGSPPLLEMRGITKDFSGGRVLFGVDFSLRAGEVHALVGQNGAGKSTLMKILAGVYADYGGQVRLGGEPIDLRDPRDALQHGVAVIYQEFALVPEMTVAENIALGQEPGSRGFVGHRQIRDDAIVETRRLGIHLPVDVPVAQLGVAGQQLTEIVKAISRRARILVMDEPTARLSGTERDRLFDIVRDLAASGVGIVYISHFLEEIFEVADRVTVLRDGRVVAVEPTSALDLGGLAQLVVGREVRETAERRLSTITDEPGVSLRGLIVPGRAGPIDLEVKAGEIVGLAGLVGAGRTSLARAMVGMERTASGSISVGDWSGLPGHPGEAAEVGILLLAEDRKRQGLVLQRSVAENIALTALRSTLTDRGFVRLRERARVVRELIERLHLVPARPDIPVSSLSGGNQQKVVFARAMAANARVLILDQPTAGVDIGAKEDLYAQIDRLAREGVAVIFISDDLDEILRLCDRIVIMRRGRAEAPVPAEGIDRAGLLEAISDTAAAA